MNTKSLWTRTISLVIIIMLALPLPTMANSGNDAEVKQTLTREQLTQLLAPVALYPDELIAQVLMASTYPLEIVMADRWVQQNRELKDNALATALEQETWDPSVKSLVNFPSVLAMLSQKLDLTTKLGDAFLEQKEDVMALIQELRAKAYSAGNLKTTQEQQVKVEEETIIIEPTDPGVVYVPTYDPYVVYGPWWYPAYPPFYFSPPPYPGSVLFSYGFGISLGLAWGYAWGGCNWHNHDVIINVNRNSAFNPYINRPRYIRHYESRGGPVQNGRIPWRHDPDHRRGVAYKQNATAREFGQLPGRRGEAGRDSRGFNVPAGAPQSPRSVGPGPGGRSAGTVQSGPAMPRPNRESVFTGGDVNADRARRSSERGRQSYDRGSVIRSGPGPASQPRTGVAPGAFRDSDSLYRGGGDRTPVGGAPQGGGGPKGGSGSPAGKSRGNERR